MIGSHFGTAPESWITNPGREVPHTIVFSMPPSTKYVDPTL